LHTLPTGNEGSQIERSTV